jgi:hypothetical protein
LALLDEYDTAGTIQTTTDVTVKIRDFTNKAMVDLASATAKIHGEQYIIHAPVYNDLACDTSSIKTFLPGGPDISITLVNALSCFFEATGPGTAVIEESADGGVTYTALETITIPSTVTTFTEYRRLITPTLATNTVRLRFTGSYVFYVRNYVLYPYIWATAADVQQFRPYFEYSLPTDFLQLDVVMSKRGLRQYSAYTNCIMRNDKKIAINRYDAPMEILVHYWRMPTLFTFTTVEVTDDAMVFGIDTSGATPTYRVSDDAALIIPHYVAGHVVLSEGSSGTTGGLTLINIYEQKKAALVSSDVGYSGTIVNVLGW